ncbi:MAG: hypothetical protein KJ077_19500 [Anaerolineae bacterium]|nr:hypothetical protein [Anaerolineae bacterium]GIK40001.1 MAG: hypothetical protein BroJett011_38340 [Chloroflexota bacterium]
MPFEHPFTGPAMTATASAVVLDPAGVQPSTIIQTEDAWRIRVNWQISGAAAPMLAGDWTVRAFLESIGPGFEGQVGPTRVVPLNPPAPALVRNYTTDIDVPGNTVAAGTYKLVTLINYAHLGVPGEMAAFVEGPVLQFYSH